MENEIRLTQSEKKILDIKNWIKSELSNEEKPKLDKSMNPYRSYKIILLRKILNKL